MSVLLTPTKEQWEVLRDIGLLSGDQGVVLLSPELQERLRGEVLQHANVSEAPGEVDHDFGGDADTWLDIVTSRDHMAYPEIRRMYFDVMGLDFPEDEEEEDEGNAGCGVPASGYCGMNDRAAGSTLCADCEAEDEDEEDD